jgi:hypothetical protein
MKDQYTVRKCGGNLGHKFFQQHHYLRGAFLRYWYYSEYIFYGLFKEDELIGVVQFCEADPRVSAKDIQIYFGFYEKGRGFWDIVRLAVAPHDEHNLTSWFLSRAIKLLRQEFDVRFLLTLADDRYHDGTIYHATNFHYYGKKNNLVPDDYSVTYHVFGKVYDKELLDNWREL